jgi:hypothetical protein
VQTGQTSWLAMILPLLKIQAISSKRFKETTRPSLSGHSSFLFLEFDEPRLICLASGWSEVSSFDSLV